MSRIHIILSSHNRREKTISCIASLLGQKLSKNALEITLFDDGSTDGTIQEVSTLYSQVNVIRGDGNQFWCRSMCLAYQAIQNNFADTDFLLCVNDDIKLYPGALEGLLIEYEKTLKANDLQAVIVGCCKNDKGQMTYGGLRRKGQIKYELILKLGESADTMNFNCVLLPGTVVKNNGFLDPKFEHAMGDIEYGIRLSKQGIKILTSTSIVASCEENNLTHNFKESNFFERCKLVLNRKYFPARSWAYFVRMTCNGLWPLYFIYPYLRFTIFPGKLN
jgi:GT2 family glycosyltransferase